MKALIKYLLLERNNDIYEQYLDYYNSQNKKTKFNLLFYTLKLIFKHLLQTKGNSRLVCFHQKRNELESLYNKIKYYDIVLIDIFNVLLLNTLEKREDIYILLNMKYGYPNFSKIRIHTEKKLREQSIRTGKNMSIDKIYTSLAASLELNADIGINNELKLLEQTYIANPYMMKFINELIKANKHIVVVNNSYYPISFVSRLLSQNGYEKFHDIVKQNCHGEFDISQLFSKKKTTNLNVEQKAIYIYNQKSKITTDVPIRIDEECCKLIDNKGIRCRNTMPGEIVFSIYNGIVNNYLYCCDEELSSSFECGFLYGGILCYGFCQWLDQMARERQITKLLFVARDGDIIHKVYDKYFGNIQSEYILYSRIAAIPIIFFENMELFFSEAVEPRLQSADMSLKILLNDLGLEKVWKSSQANDTDYDRILNITDLEAVKNFFLSHKNQIQKIYAVRCDSMKKYIKHMAGDSKNICVIDLGWRGFSILQIKKILEDLDSDYTVMGALMASANCEFTNPFLTNNTILTYLPYKFSAHYSKRRSAQLLSLKDILIMEALFSSPTPSLVGINMESNGKFSFEYEQLSVETQKNNFEVITNIHAGIMNFSEIFHKRLKALAIPISIRAEEAFYPLKKILRNEKYIRYLFNGYTEDSKALHGYNKTRERQEL